MQTHTFEGPMRIWNRRRTMRKRQEQTEMKTTVWDERKTSFFRMDFVWEGDRPSNEFRKIWEDCAWTTASWDDCSGGVADRRWKACAETSENPGHNRREVLTLWARWSRFSRGTTCLPSFSRNNGGNGNLLSRIKSGFFSRDRNLKCMFLVKGAGVVIHGHAGTSDRSLQPNSSHWSTLQCTLLSRLNRVTPKPTATQFVPHPARDSHLPHHFWKQK